MPRIRRSAGRKCFTLLYNSLKLSGNLPQSSGGQPLSAFSDADKIAGWAKEAMEQMAANGIAGGSGGKLSPADTATRAEWPRSFITCYPDSIYERNERLWKR